jgi:hypothetical protein
LFSFVVVYYSGYGTANEIKLFILGDAEKKHLVVDLSKPPFNLSFQGNFPTRVYAKNEGAIMSTPIVSVSGNILTLDYPEPLPPPNEGALSPRSQLTIYLFYGMVM